MHATLNLARRTHSPTVRLVQTATDLSAIGRLRYEVYVAEMGRRQEFADPAAQTVIEPVDAASMVFGAFDAEGAAQGTFRLTPVGDLDAESGQFYGWTVREFSSPGSCCVASKLMVASAWRSGMLGIEILRAATVEFLHRGFRYCFLDANDHLVPLYTRLGFVATRRREHPSYGPVTVMEFDTYDLGHARAVRSPLLRELERYQANRAIVA